MYFAMHPRELIGMRKYAVTSAGRVVNIGSLEKPYSIVGAERVQI
jgi:hypothetical protein